MPRRWFVVILLVLGVVEIGLLVHGWRHPSEPQGPEARGEDLPQTLVAPRLRVEPDEGFDWVYQLVGQAKSKVDVVMYELVDTRFSQALVEACGRGVKVRLILDQNLEKQSNMPAYTQLSTAGPNCAVAWANPHFHATHEKAMVIDEATAVVMSFNLTSRYYADTRDMALVVTDVPDVVGIRLAFAMDFRSTETDPADPQSGHDLIWSPTTAEDDLVSLIQGAKHTLMVENEELSAPVIVEALAAACKRGVQVRLAMTDTSAGYHANFGALEAAGCGVHVGANNEKTLYIHAKALVADLGKPEAIGYVGSINFSNASMDENRELGLYVHDAALLKRMSSVMTSDYDQFPAYAPSVRLPNTAEARP